MKNLGKLSEAELSIMLVIWEKAIPVTVSSLLDAFMKSKGWKTSTLSTMLARLIEKGFLKKVMEGKANLYTPTITLEEFRSYETKSFVESIHGGSVKSFIAAFADEDITQGEINELKKWLESKAGEV